MIDCCECRKSYDIKVEGDIGADAIWCNKCFANFNIEDVSISNELKVQLRQWILQYGQWIDWENGGILPNGVALEEEHNDEGLKLTKKVQTELAGKYKVSFSPSIFAKNMSKTLT